MPRVTSPTLDARLDAQVTAVGYLLLMRANAVHSVAKAPSVLQLSDIGTITNAAGTWVESDFEIKGAGTENVGLSIQNLDGAAGAFALNADPLGDVEFLLWQFERDDPENPVFLGDFRAANSKVGIERCDFALRQTNLQYRFAPTRRICSRDGFHYALRPGEILLWGAQRIIIKDRR